MSKLAVLLLFPIVLIAGPRDDDKAIAAGYARLAALMPDDQKQFAAGAESVDKLDKAARLETNGLKRKELWQQRDGEFKELVADAKDHLHVKGCKGWVTVCIGSDERCVLLSMPTVFQVHLYYEGMIERNSAVVRNLKPGDVVRFTTAPDGVTLTATRPAVRLAALGPNARAIELVTASGQDR